MLPSRQVNAQPINAAVADGCMIAPTTDMATDRAANPQPVKPESPNESRMKKGGIPPNIKNPRRLPQKFLRFSEITTPQPLLS